MQLILGFLAACLSLLLAPARAMTDTEFYTLSENVRVCRENRHVDPNQATQPHHPPFVWDSGWDFCQQYEDAFTNANADRRAKAKAAAEPDRERLLKDVTKIPQ